MLGAGRGPFCYLPQGPFGVAGLLNEGIGLTSCEAAVPLHLVSVKISNAYFNDCPRKIVLPPSSHSHLPVRDDAFVQLVPKEQGQWPPSAHEGGPLGSRLNAVCQMRTSTRAHAAAAAGGPRGFTGSLPPPSPVRYGAGDVKIPTRVCRRIAHFQG